MYGYSIIMLLPSLVLLFLSLQIHRTEGEVATTAASAASVGEVQRMEYMESLTISSSIISSSSPPPSLATTADVSSSISSISSSQSSKSTTTMTKGYSDGIYHTSAGDKGLYVDGLEFLDTNTNVTIIDKRGTIEGHMRKLMGSTCLVMERGVITKYYECIGCKIELAQACIDDMRHNRSGNVGPHCHINMITKAYESKACCPTYQNDLKKSRRVYTRTGKLNLMYIGTQYPEAIRCLETVGCTSSVIYSQLLQECAAVCPFQDPRGTGDVCRAQMNSANRLSHQSTITYLFAVSVSLFISLFFL